MKRWYTVLVMCAVVAAVWSSVRLAPPAGRVQDVGNEANVVAYGDAGVPAWAPQDEGRFAMVRPGMHERDVVALLGAPLHEYCLERGHGRTLVYSSGPVRGESGWWARTIHVGAGGHVTRFESHHQVD